MGAGRKGPATRMIARSLRISCEGIVNGSYEFG